MKRLAMAAMIAAMAVPVMAQTQAGAPPRQEAPLEMISVAGEGRVKLTPDRVRFNVGVETTAATPSEALEQNNQKIKAVIDALRKRRGEVRRDSDLELLDPSAVRVRRQQRPRIIGYQVTNTVTVTRDVTSDSGRLLQAAVNAGVNQASGLSFFVADESPAREQGLRSAFADARAKAETLARAAGRTVGRAVAITEGGAPPVVVPQMYGRMAMAVGSEDDGLERSGRAGTARAHLHGLGGVRDEVRKAGARG
jgi:uncharacterized protein